MSEIIEDIDLKAKEMLQKMGQRIRSLRRLKNLTQEQITDATGISQNHLSQVESGKAKLGDKRLIQLAELFDVSVAYLMGFGPDEIDVADFLSAKQNEDAKEKPAIQVSQATLDLETMIKDLMYEYPDLALGFRDTRENWATLPEEDKKSIASALMQVFRPNSGYPSRLRSIGRKGQV
jgi:transcriptional regulator with XRE-family HTH domain